LYEHGEGAKLAGFTIGTVRYLTRQGYFTTHQDEFLLGDNPRVLGQELLDAQRALRGRRSIHEVLYDRFDTSFTPQMERVERLLGKMSDMMPPLIFNITDDETPCYFLEELACHPFVKSLSTRHMNLRSPSCDPAAAFAVMADTYKGRSQLAEYAEVKQSVIDNTLSWAKKNGVNIDSKRSGRGGTGFRHRFGDVAAAHLEMVQ
tara:strand:- start:1 stop:612 length:612 start_codon:yes stop_codon:yes gene_type:complete